MSNRLTSIRVLRRSTILRIEFINMANYPTTLLLRLDRIESITMIDLKDIIIRMDSRIEYRFSLANADPVEEVRSFVEFFSQ